MAGNGPTPGGFDLGDHLLSGGRVGAPSEKVAPEIVHHDPGALSGEKQRMRSPQTAPGARDNRHPAIQRSHPSSSSRRTCVGILLASVFIDAPARLPAQTSRADVLSEKWRGAKLGVSRFLLEDFHHRQTHV